MKSSLLFRTDAALICILLFIGCLIMVMIGKFFRQKFVDKDEAESKGGVNSLTRALAKELAPSGIPVNAIACGCVDTRMNAQLSAEEKAELSEEIPAGRFAQPSEIARAVLSLIHAPAYLTGQIVTVDGGWI